MDKYRTKQVAPSFQLLNRKSQRTHDRAHTYEAFADNPVSAQVGGGAASGTDTDTNVLLFPDNAFEYNIKGTQDIKAPSILATGLDIGMDQTADDGVELTQGILANAKHYFTVGTSSPFFFRVKFSIQTVAGTDDCAIGFRKAEAYQGNIDDYNDMAVLNVIAGDINIETITGGAGTTTTDTTDNWADGETYTLTVKVDADGAVTYLIDGAAPSTLPASAFSFADTTKVIPFLFFLNHSSGAGEVIIQEWECGLQTKYHPSA